MSAINQLLSSYGPAASTGNLYDEIMADSPWVYYQLGETAGATSYADSSGNARSLTNIVATITAGSTALCAPGTSVDFNGSGYISCTNNQYGTAQNTAFAGDKAFTICQVLRLDTLAAAVVSIHLGNNSVNGAQGFYVTISSAGVVTLNMRDSASGSFKSLATAAGVVASGNTYLLQYRRAVGGAAKIVVNGVSVATGTMTGNIAMNATASNGGQRIMLGALNTSAPSNQIDGRMQHAAVFTSALSDARLAAQFSASGL